MRLIKFNILLASICILIGFSSCEKITVIEDRQIDEIIYEIDTVSIYANASEKTKQKTSTQFNRIVYADIFRKGISAVTLSTLDEMRIAIGDKTVFNILLIRSYLNSTEAVLPLDADMRYDISAFVKATYKRFFLRNPQAYELAELTLKIQSNTSMTVKEVFEAFITSNEYGYY